MIALKNETCLKKCPKVFSGSLHLWPDPRCTAGNAGYSGDAAKYKPNPKRWNLFIAQGRLFFSFVRSVQFTAAPFSVFNKIFIYRSHHLHIRLLY